VNLRPADCIHFISLAATSALTSRIDPKAHKPLYNSLEVVLVYPQQLRESALALRFVNAKDRQLVQPMTRLIMRLLFFCILAVSCLSISARADSTAFTKQIIAHIAANPMKFPAEFINLRPAPDLILVFSLDRNGNLLNPSVKKGSGLTKVDQASLEWLATLQPFPALPANATVSETITLPIRFMSRSGESDYEHSERKIKQMIGNVCKGC
jgi:TonB family protein